MNILNILKSGAVVNFTLVIVGSILGLLFKKGIPEKIKKAIFTGMALCVLLIGIDGMLSDNYNILIVIVSMALGAVIGELIDINKWVNILAEKIELKFYKNQNSKIAEGFVAATLLFCVGAMTIVGSIDSGISGDNATLYSKSLIDCIAAIPLAATFGFGVTLSSIAVLVIEGALTLFSVIISPILTEEIILHMSTIGSMLIVALSLNMLDITKIKVMNYIPAVFLPILIFAII